MESFQLIGKLVHNLKSVCKQFACNVEPDIAAQSARDACCSKIVSTAGNIDVRVTSTTIDSLNR